MDPERNRQIVKRWFKSFGQGQLDPDDLTDDFVWRMPASVDINSPGKSRDCRGIEGLREIQEMAELVYDKSHPGKSTKHFMISEGDFVVLHSTMERKTKAGVSYENDYVFCFQLRGEKIARVWEYTDTAHALRQFAAAPGE